MTRHSSPRKTFQFFVIAPARLITSHLTGLAHLPSLLSDPRPAAVPPHRCFQTTDDRVELILWLIFDVKMEICLGKRGHQLANAHERRKQATADINSHQ